MVDTEIICTFVGIIGNFISLGLLACAVPTFSKIAMNNSVRGLKLVYHLAMTLSSLFWVLYGMPFIHRGFIPVLTSNGIILATQLAYLTISLVYANDNKQRMYVGAVFLIELVVFGLAIGLVIRQSPTSKTREEVAGVFCIVSYALILVPEALCVVELQKTGSVENVQTRNLVGNMLYRLCWTIYASFKYDVVLGAVNFSGFLFGVFHIKVYDVYYKRYAKSGVEKKLETAEVQV
ncbi:hypothetical protein POM88_034462 [Heracleum sosnowskyi]|uniref:Bidirectional sugar transporter SWEET n=1 Tax=Heracleum sosnowskyi TaxID=360622 RepID=A0AAD8MAK5_9APIA|nr:hypothetical protein POM88_034462 [Heracleum sosnowskyi]